MKCFKHRNEEAICVCRSCFKAVCKDCAIDSNYGLVCSDICLKEANEQQQIIEKSKRIYSIGTNSRLLPTGILMYFFFSILFGGFGLYETISNGRSGWFPLAMGIGFLAFGLLGWYKNRKLNINC